MLPKVFSSAKQQQQEQLNQQMFSWSWQWGHRDGAHCIRLCFVDTLPIVWWVVGTPLNIYSVLRGGRCMGGLTLSPRLIDSLTPCSTVWLERSLSEPTSHIHFLPMNLFLSKSSCQMSVIESTESDNCRNAYMFGMGFSTMHYHYQGVILAVCKLVPSIKNVSWKITTIWRFYSSNWVKMCS